MTTPLQSLIATGTKLWLDSIDPDVVARNRAWGATGATSNPIIIADLIKTGRFDAADGPADPRRASATRTIAWQLTDTLVRQAQEVFLPVWEARPRATTATSASSSTRCSKTRASTLPGRRADAAVHRAGQEVERPATTTA